LHGGIGIDVTGAYPDFTITSLSPGDSLNLHSGTGIEVTGAYPDFTVTNLAPDVNLNLDGGAGINVSGSYPEYTVTNLAPDLNLTLNNGSGINVSGTYPVFSIENTSPDIPVNLTGGPAIGIIGSYPDYTIFNMSPDQIVSLSNGTGISIAGTYPAFTITNSSPDRTVSIAQGTGITVSGAYPNFMVTNSMPNATHTGDATGNAALTVVKIQGRDVSATAPSTNQILKWNGSAWVPNTDATRDGCPSGFTSVNSEYCIQTNMLDWTSRTWFNAITACGDISGGSHMCSWAEWYNACTRAASLGLSNMTGYWQWMDDGVSANTYARVAGSGGCTSRDNKDVDVSTNSTYTRCCYDK